MLERIDPGMRVNYIIYVQIITQNVDGLHEKAGSTNVLHLHGELLKVRSTKNPDYILDWQDDLNFGDFDNMGNQLRPHIVWFGESVPMIEIATEMTAMADILIIVGTSMQVYPAAGLIDCVGKNVPIYIIDPNKPNVSLRPNMTFIEEIGSVGLKQLFDKLTKK